MTTTTVWQSMRLFLSALLAVTLSVSAYGQQSTEEQLADALRLIQQLELERDLAQLEADEAKLAARRDQIALRQAQLEIEQLKAQQTSDNANAGTPTVEASVELAKRDGQVEETPTLRCSASSPEVCTTTEICRLATYGRPKRWHAGGSLLVYSDEAMLRGLTCGVVEQAETTSTNATYGEVCSRDNIQLCNADQLCGRATYGSPKRWHSQGVMTAYATEAQRQGLTCGVAERAAAPTDAQVCADATWQASTGRTYWSPGDAREEARRRGLTCGVGQRATTSRSNTQATGTCSRANPQACSSTRLCFLATFGTPKRWKGGIMTAYTNEAKSRGLSCGVTEPTTPVRSSGECRMTSPQACDDNQLCTRAVTGDPKRWFIDSPSEAYSKEAQRRGLTCGVGGQLSSTSGSSSGQCRSTNLGPCNEQELCDQAVRNISGVKSWVTTGYRGLYAGEARRRGLTCGIGGSSSRSTSSSSSSTQRNTTSNASSSASGCTSSGRGFGMAGSLFWHRTASVACKREYFERECRGFGFAAGTPEMAQCVANQSTNSRNGARQTFNNALNNWQNQMNSPSNRTLYGDCRQNVFGNFDCTIR